MDTEGVVDAQNRTVGADFNDGEHATVSDVGNISTGSSPGSGEKVPSVDKVGKSKFPKTAPRQPDTSGSTSQENLAKSKKSEIKKVPENPLEEYGQGSPQEDLELIYGAMEMFRRAVYSTPRAYPPAANNKIFTGALLGKNRDNFQIIERSSDYINGDGELIDRWGTPIELHFVSSTSIGLRSAGPDKKLYTQDDFHIAASEPVGMIDSDVSQR